MSRRRRSASCWSPRAARSIPVLLMESLFRLTELELRFGLNMNVLSAGQVPNVLSLRDVLRQWLEHRIDVLVRRTQFRLKKIEHRLEVLDGYLIAFLNIDEVIRIVRFEDDPKAEADRPLQAHRRAGRGDPELALAVAGQARGDRDQGRARQAVEGAARAEAAPEVRRPAVGEDHRRGQGDARALLEEDRARARAAPRLPRRPSSRSISTRP